MTDERRPLGTYLLFAVALFSAVFVRAYEEDRSAVSARRERRPAYRTVRLAMDNDPDRQEKNESKNRVVIPVKTLSKEASKRKRDTAFVSENEQKFSGKTTDKQQTRWVRPRKKPENSVQKRDPEEKDQKGHGPGDKKPEYRRADSPDRQKEPDTGMALAKQEEESGKGAAKNGAQPEQPERDKKSASGSRDQEELEAQGALTANNSDSEERVARTDKHRQSGDTDKSSRGQASSIPASRDTKDSEPRLQENRPGKEGRESKKNKERKENNESSENSENRKQLKQEERDTKENEKLGPGGKKVNRMAQAKQDFFQESIKTFQELPGYRNLNSELLVNFSHDGSISLGTEAFRNSDYFFKMVRKISRAWQMYFPVMQHYYGLLKRGEILVVFRLNAEGELKDVRLARSYGQHILDRACTSAIREAAPFGQLPEEYRKKGEMTVPFLFVYRPPENPGRMYH